MANICCDDVIFYTEGNPEGLYDLWGGPGNLHHSEPES